jgi:hypothetical protein
VEREDLEAARGEVGAFERYVGELTRSRHLSTIEARKLAAGADLVRSLMQADTGR